MVHISRGNQEIKLETNGAVAGRGNEEIKLETDGAVAGNITMQKLSMATKPGSKHARQAQSCRPAFRIFHGES